MVTSPEDNEPDRSSQDEAVQRARRRAAIFGDVLPDATSDDTDESSAEEDRSSDEWLRRQVPPHHG